MTEEALAAQLGLKETWRMKFARWRTLKAAPRSDVSGSKRYLRALNHYQQLGEAAVDRKPNEDNARVKAQLALVLLVASIRRDIRGFNPHYEERRLEDMNYALIFALNRQLGTDITDAIERLIKL